MPKTWRITGRCRGSERVLPLESLGPVAARFNQNRSVVPASGLSHRTMGALIQAAMQRGLQTPSAEVELGER
jgi:hypothetical protein